MKPPFAHLVMKCACMDPDDPLRWLPNLCLGLQCDLFPSGLAINILHVFLEPPLPRATCTASSFIYFCIYVCIYLFAYDTFRVGVGMLHCGVMIWLVLNQLQEMRKETTVVCFYVVALNLRGRTEEIHETLGLACVSAEKQTGHLQNRSRHRTVLSN